MEILVLSKEAESGKQLRGEFFHESNKLVISWAEVYLREPEREESSWHEYKPLRLVSNIFNRDTNLIGSDCGTICAPQNRGISLHLVEAKSSP